ncbi:GNAT family N-acetyltransferase [Magnetospira thiophila]
MGLKLTICESLDSLPAHVGRLFEACGANGFFSSLTWYRCLAAHTLESTDRVRLYVVEETGLRPRARLIFPSLERRPCGRLAPRQLSSLTNVYTVLWDLLLDPDQPDPQAAVDFLVDHLCSRDGGWDSLEFRALDRDSPTFDWLSLALRRHGWAVQPFFQYANIYETILDDDSAAYLARRGSSIRQTLLRMERKAERSGVYAHHMQTTPDGLEQAIADYQRVYAASWKQPEASETFLPELMRAAACEGSLRLGLIYWNGQPVAEQLSFVRGGRASMYKTAYDEAYKKQALGRLSLLHLLRHVIDQDHVREVDFGIGAEPYKEEWLFQRRELWGLAAFNPRRPKGLFGTLRHVLAPRLKKLLRR